MSNPYQSPPQDAYGGAPGYGRQPEAYGPQPGWGYPGSQTGGGYPAPPYGAPYGAPPALTGEPNNLATASVALGFISVVICFYGILLSPVALGLGIAALNRSKTSGTGRSTAIGGIVLASVAIAVALAEIVFFVAQGEKAP